MSHITACESWLEQECGGRALLVPSCTAALEAAVILSGARDVVLPSFAYPTCASSIIRAGAKPVFADIDLDTLCLDYRGGEWSMPIWYAGVQGSPKGLAIEDAAQCIGAYRLRGRFGCISFHRTKNVQCGEGGALIVHPEDYERARVFTACGTNRWKDRKDWTWLEVGTSSLMAEPLAETLLPELEACYEITEQRLRVWRVYRDNIKASHRASVPGNGHIFWFMSDKQAELLEKMPELRKHYEPLHLCRPGLKYKRLGDLKNSVYAASHIVRPPMNVTEDEAFGISERINDIGLGRV